MCWRPYHLLDIDAAYTVGDRDIVRWTFANGSNLSLPIELAHRFGLAWRGPDKPTRFARAGPDDAA